MSEIEKKEKRCWTEVLPFLFNLLVENADAIIDDTSLERVLEWLKTVCKNEEQLQMLRQCGTVEFLASEQVFSNPESAAFFLRLFGFLASREKGFNSLQCVKGGEFLSRFLTKPRNEPELWNEGIVRNGYFQALISLTEHKDGMRWLKSTCTGHIDCALECTSDRSIFVANSARSLIATYLIKESEVMLSHNSKETLHNILDNKHVAIITERLRSLLSSEFRTFPLSAIAAIEITRMLLCENSITGQKLLQESRMLPECLNLIEVGDAAVCQKLVEVLCEMAKNTSTWALDWDKLVCAIESSASNILLGSCMGLFKKGLISTGLELVAGLGFCQESSRDFSPHWLEVLFDIVEVPLELVLNPACHDSKNTQNGFHNGGEDLNVGLIDGLMSGDEQQKSSAKQQLQCLLNPWIKENRSQTQVIHQALAAAEQLMQQASSKHHSHVLHWTKHSLNIVQYCVDPTKQCAVELHGNQKILKAALEFITSFTDLQRSTGILEFTDSSTFNQLFDDLVRTLLELIESSETSGTVVSSSLKTLGKVLLTARPEFITELFSSDTATEGSSRKRARLDQSPACEDVQQRANVKAANCEKLAFVLYRRLRDSRWEVRDSTLEFVASLLQVNQDSVHDFLCRHSIPVIVWNATDDTNSYVRASAIHVIGSLACQSQLWTPLLQTCHVTEESILEKLSSVLENDDEAFPRRRAMECLTLWIQTRHPTMTAQILRFEKSSRPDNENTPLVPEVTTSGTNTEIVVVKDAGDRAHTERIPNSDDVQDLGVGSQSEARKPTSGFNIGRTVCRACQDFDWEVKLRGLEFWEAGIEFFTGVKTKKESANADKAKSGSVESMKPGKNGDLFQVLFDMGALNILSDALSDCDLLVCEKAIEILACLQVISNPEKSDAEKRVKTSWEFQTSLGSAFSLEKFKTILRAAEFSALTQSTEAADSAVRSDPVSLIEDILMAATHRDENLLDCY